METSQDTQEEKRAEGRVLERVTKSTQEEWPLGSGGGADEGGALCHLKKGLRVLR